MAEDRFDVAVIGGGPGGYVCAIRAAQLGLDVACIDKRGRFGGTCLNIGCIPSKALLHSSHEYERAQNHLPDLGIKTGKVGLDLKKVMAHKDKAVDELTKGVEYLLKKNKIEAIAGEARLKGGGAVEIRSGNDKERVIEADHIVIATGSDVAGLPDIEIDEDRILSSTGALSLSSVPKKMVVIGGGYIGLEMGSVWSRLGADVVVVEFLDRILAGMDGEVAKTMHRLLKKQGLDIRTKTKVTGVETLKTKLKVETAPADDKKGNGKEGTIDADVVLVAVGRTPFTGNLGLEDAGVKTDDKGRIEIDGRFRTSAEGVYAIGDVIAGPMLAHKASEEGAVLAEQIAGIAGAVNYDAIPAVVYTQPEAASVGVSEEALKEEGADYKAAKFAFSANARAKITGGTDGFVKILSEKATDRVRGVHIVGSDAGNLIAEAVLAMEYGASAEDIARTCHAHPTEAEAVKEAALAAGEGAIHS